MTSRRRWLTAGLVLVAVLATALAANWAFRGEPRTGAWAVAGLTGSQQRVATFPELEKLSRQAARPATDFPTPSFTLNDVAGERITPAVERQSLLGAPALVRRSPRAIVAELADKSGRSAADNNALVNAQLDLGQVDAAIAVRRAVVDRTPDDNAAWDALLLLLHKQNRVDAYLAASDECLAIALQPAADVNDVKQQEKIISRARTLISRRAAVASDALRPTADNEAFQIKLIDAFPRDASLLNDYARQLINDNRLADAVAVLEPRLERSNHDQALWQTLIDAYDKQGRLTAALQRLEPTLAGPEDDRYMLFVTLLRKTNLIDARREQLLADVKAGPTVANLAALLRIESGLGKSELARRAFRDTAPLLAAGGDPRTLSALARMADWVDATDDAVAYRIDAALLAGDDDPSLWLAAARAIAGSGSAKASPLAASPAAAFTAHFVDAGPGVVGGLVSLGTNRMDAPEAMATMPRDAGRTGAMRQAMHLALRALDRSPDAKLAYEAGSFLAEQWERLQQPDRLDDLARRVAERLGDESEHVVTVLLWHDTAARLRDDFEGRLTALRAAVERGRQLSRRAEADQAQRTLENLLIGKERYAEVLALKWQRVESYPDDEKAIQDLLSFAERYEMFADAERAYRRAIEQFDRRTWSDKFARWLLRKERRAAFESLVADTARQLGENDLSEFLNDQVRYSSSNSASRLFFEKVYTLGVERFPANLTISRRLLDFYESEGFRRREPVREYQDKFLDLGLRIFALDDEVPARLLHRLAQRKMLDGLAVKLTAQDALDPAEAYLWTRVQQYRADFEAARAGYLVLAEHWPGDKTIVAAVATLSRSLADSFYVRDPQLFDAAAEAYGKLATRHPLETGPATLRGETLVEAGRPREAASTWEAVVAASPGQRERWLELATLYWDYYLPAQAKHTLTEARRVLDEPDLFAKEMAYLLEDEGDIAGALTELVAVIVTTESWNDNYRDADGRLRYLVQRRKTDDAAVGQAFWKRLKRPARRGSEGVAYLSWLRTRGRIADARSAARRLLPLYDDTIFAEAAFEFFGQYDDQDGALAALERIATIGNRDHGMLRRLAAFHENRGNRDQADAVLAELLAQADTPLAQRQAWSFAAQYYWRTERRPLALGYYRRVAERPDAGHNLGAWITYADRAIEAERPDDALTALRKLRETFPRDEMIVAAIGRAYSAKNDRAALVEFYQDALKQVAASNDSRDYKRDREIALRYQLIATLTDLSQTREAVEHHIKIINRLAPDTDPVDRAIAYARRHGQTAPLLAYYEREAERANRDYRWQYVAAQIREAQVDYNAAAALLKKAAANEPQLIELHQRWAGVLIKAERFDEAIDVYRELDRRRLTGDDYQLRIAEVMFLAGKPDTAEKWLDEILAADDVAVSRVIASARLTDRFGRDTATARLADRALRMILEKPTQRSADDGFYQLWLRGLLESRGATTALAAIDNSRTALQRLQTTSHPVGKRQVGSTIAQLDKLAYDYLATWLGRHATTDERAAAVEPLGTLLRAPLATTTANGRDRVFSRAIDAAERAGLITLASQLRQERLRDLDDTPKGLTAINRRLRCEPLGELTTEVAALPRADITDFDGMLRLRAALARAVGDESTEKALLGKYFNLASNRIFSAPGAAITRYFSLLTAPEFDALVAGECKRPGMLIVHLAMRGDTARVVAALDHHYADGNPKWLLATKTLVYQHDAAYAADARAGYGKLLGLPLRIGQHAGVEPGPQQLTGSMWTRYAHRYAAWLASLDDPAAARFLPARPERSPVSPSAYLAVAAALDEAGRFADAEDYLDRAANFGATDALIHARALHLIAQGKKGAAVREYEKLITGDQASLSRVIEYAQNVAGLGRADDGVDKWRDALVERLPRLGSYDRRWEAERLITFTDAHLGRRAASRLAQGVLSSHHFDAADLRSLAEGESLPAEIDLWLWQAAVARIAVDARAPQYAKESLARAALTQGLTAEDKTLCRQSLALLDQVAPDTYASTSVRRQRLRFALLTDGPRAAERLATAWAVETEDTRFARGLAADFKDAELEDEGDRVWIAFFQARRAASDASLFGRDDRGILLQTLGATLRQDQREAAQLVAPELEELAGENVELLATTALVLAQNGWGDEAERWAAKALALGPASAEANRAGVLVRLAGERYDDAARLLAEGWAAGLYGQPALRAILDEATNATQKRGAADWLTATSLLPRPVRQLAAALIHLSRDDGRQARAALASLDEPLRYPLLVWRMRAAAQRLTQDRRGEHEALSTLLTFDPSDDDAARRLAWLELAEHPFAALLRLNAQGMPMDPKELADPLQAVSYNATTLTRWWERVPADDRADLAVAMMDAFVALDGPATAARCGETALATLGVDAPRALRKKVDTLNNQLAERRRQPLTRFVPTSNLAQ